MKDELFQAQVNTRNGHGWFNMSYSPRSHDEALKLITHYQVTCPRFDYRIVEFHE